MEILMMLVSTLTVIGMMLVPLVAPFFGFRWTKRKFGKTPSHVFLFLIVAISTIGILDAFYTVRELSDQGAWTAAALAPLGLVFTGLPIMLVVTVVWMGTLSLLRITRSI